MNLQQFVDKYNLKWVKNGGLSQCVALCRQYFDDVLHIPQFPQIIGAYQIYDIVSGTDFEKVLNTRTNFPPRGAIIIWKKEYGGNGHVGLVLDADVNGALVLSQNHTGNLDPCEVVSYSYSLVKGWLIYKKKELNMTYDLYRDAKGDVYERLNNYALVHIPSPEFLKTYYGDSPTITQVDDIWSVGWIAEDPRPLKNEIASLGTEQSRLKGVVSDIQNELKTLTARLVEANKTIEEDTATMLEENKTIEELKKQIPVVPVKPELPTGSDWGIKPVPAKDNLLERIFKWIDERIK